MSVKSQLISTAQWYGGAGFPVFPIHWPEQDGCSCRKSDCPSPAKHPLTPHGFQDASQDRAMITEWWSRWPAANIGLTTGTPSGLLVVDIDPRNGGDRSLQTVIAKNGNLPATAQQFTGGGGRHFFFRYSGGRVPKTLAEGIDLKGDGGYVVIAPSRHYSGGDYRWAGEEGKESPPAPGRSSGLVADLHRYPEKRRSTPRAKECRRQVWEGTEEQPANLASGHHAEMWHGARSD